MTEIVEHFLTGMMMVGLVSIYYSINFPADLEENQDAK